ncbi:peroxide stress protein YaaA [Nocardioides xinjiangensis]|uniref:peroxide stress protein YaaA n=1 Tax=Nocardioides xinjiangensis TaxID=2817376 RepID=UPI001B30EDC3|nr:peroxide stress protein YaaA [Nocardioides sp. SYSU D00778]
MLILLPPSEGKSAPRRGRSVDLASLSSPALTPTRTALLQALTELCRDDPEKAVAVLGLGPAQHDLVQRNAVLGSAPTARADAIYTGVLYDALGFATLSPAARRRASARLAVTSSLFGIVRPGDRIPAYRLSGDAVLPDVGSVAGAWREVLGGAVADALRGGLLVDLRSSTYAAFWRPAGDVGRRTATVRVLHESGGRRTVVSHFNKATKGRIVRALLEDGADPRTPAALADTLTRLGWTVEVGEPTPKGTQLDVVVAEA